MRLWLYPKDLKNGYVHSVMNHEKLIDVPFFVTFDMLTEKAQQAVRAVGKGTFLAHPNAICGLDIYPPK